MFDSSLSSGTSAGVGVGEFAQQSGAPFTSTLNSWLKTEPSAARMQQQPVCVPINTPGLVFETTTATQPGFVLKVAPPLGGVTSRYLNLPGWEGRLKIPCALSCRLSPIPIGVDVATGLQGRVGVGVGVLVDVGVFVGDPFGVGVTVGTGVPVGGGPKQTVRPSST
ncbi:MAG TPA: hypothetical protein VHY56_11650 [Candidatus Binataceae bacterium]|nr:hypothetical protein [Candidatus Binataceae bacterium]